MLTRNHNVMVCAVPSSSSSSRSRHDVVVIVAVVKLWGNAGERRSPSVFGGGTPFP